MSVSYAPSETYVQESTARVNAWILLGLSALLFGVGTAISMSGLEVTTVQDVPADAVAFQMDMDGVRFFGGAVVSAFAVQLGIFAIPPWLHARRLGRDRSEVVGHA